jgi:hypothetical protein
MCAIKHGRNGKHIQTHNRPREPLPPVREEEHEEEEEPELPPVEEDEDEHEDEEEEDPDLAPPPLKFRRRTSMPFTRFCRREESAERMMEEDLEEDLRAMTADNSSDDDDDDDDDLEEEEEEDDEDEQVHHTMQELAQMWEEEEEADAKAAGKAKAAARLSKWARIKKGRTICKRRGAKKGKLPPDPPAVSPLIPERLLSDGNIMRLKHVDPVFHNIWYFMRFSLRCSGCKEPKWKGTPPELHQHRPLPHRQPAQARVNGRYGHKGGYEPFFRQKRLELFGKLNDRNEDNWTWTYYHRRQTFVHPSRIPEMKKGFGVRSEEHVKANVNSSRERIEECKIRKGRLSQLRMHETMNDMV